VKGPAEFDFALYINDLSAAWSNLAGDAGGMPKGKSAKLGDAKAIDLTDMRSHAVDKHHFFEDDLLRPVSQPCGAPNACHQGAVDVGPRDDAAFCFPGAKIGLDQNLSQLFYDQRKLAGMVGRACRMFEHEGHCIAIQGVQTFALRDGRQQLREDCLVFGCSREIVFEIGKNFEMLCHFGIEGSEQKIQQAVAE